MNEFLDHIQRHEREWGTESYPGRLTLSQIMAAKVIVFWIPNQEGNKRITKEVQRPREIITAHDSLREVEVYLTRLVMFTKTTPPDKRFLRAYVEQKPVKVKSVRIEFAFVEST